MDRDRVSGSAPQPFTAIIARQAATNAILTLKGPDELTNLVKSFSLWVLYARIAWHRLPLHHAKRLFGHHSSYKFKIYRPLLGKMQELLLSSADGALWRNSVPPHGGAGSGG